MILSSAITIGQLTFVLRVAIQILSYGGLALITLIIIGNAPRVAPIDTHNVISYVIGKSSSTSVSAKWVFNRLLRGGRKDPIPSTNLLIAVFLFISYTAFVAVSDIGFLGFYSCSVPGPSLIDFPASISSDNAARALVLGNLVNGTDPSSVKAYRCDAVQVVNFDVNVTENNCTSWRNSTYADTNLFTGINSTDTDVLMPRRLSRYSNFPREKFISLNSYNIGPSNERVTNATIHDGIALVPHDTGLTVVLGVPQLAPQHKVALTKTMALEVDVGCMSLGVYSEETAQGGSSGGFDIFATQGNWRKFIGPDYLRNVLSNTTDIIREYYRPFFNTSSMDSNGLLTSINQTSAVLSAAASVSSFLLPTSGFQTGPDDYILGNCTVALQNQLGIPISQQANGRMCGLLQIGGSAATNGTLFKGVSRMVCATATQVNMVAATVAVDAESQVSLDITRLPSDLNYLRADYWDFANKTYANFVPYERYTLSYNLNSPTTHFIPHQTVLVSTNALGPGSGGTPFSRIGDLMLASDFALSPLTSLDYVGITLLPQGFNQFVTGPGDVTTWSAQLGASFISASSGYNGWAARTSAPIQVVSTGGRTGSCYKPRYALGFLPLVFAALLVIVWSCILLVRSSLLGSTPLQLAYGGMGPYKGAVCPGAPDQDTLVAWEAAPEPHLQVISKGSPIMGDGPKTALIYLKTGDHEYPFTS